MYLVEEQGRLPADLYLQTGGFRGRLRGQLRSRLLDTHLRFFLLSLLLFGFLQRLLQGTRAVCEEGVAKSTN